MPYSQGLYLVEALLQVVTVNKWNIEHWNEYFKQWFMLLLSLVDFNQDPQICLEVMLSSKYLAVKKYRTFLHKEVGMADYIDSFDSGQVILREK